MLLDTNVWSELVRPCPEPAVVEFIDTHFDELYLSTLVVAELEFGIARTSDEASKARLVTFLADLVWRCADRTIAPDLNAAVTWGRVKAALYARGEPIADMDLMIAAQAIAAEMPLVTRNLSDMTRTGATIINPWQP